MLGIAEGLEALHLLNKAHRDIKPDNILLHKNVPKIADFGLAITASTLRSKGTMARPKGTPLYMSPEQFRGKKAHTSMDVFAFGVLLNEVYRGEPPYQKDPDLEEVTFESLCCHVALSKPPGRPKLTSHAEAAALAQRCWEHDPAKRPSMGDVVDEIEKMIEEM